MANHLLSEVYISLGQYDEAIKSASELINSGDYQLMTERFGSKMDEPGDVYSDLHQAENMTRSSGNMEAIYTWQFEHFIAGGDRKSTRLKSSHVAISYAVFCLKDKE